MRSERTTYLDIGSSAEAEAGRGSGAEAPRGAGWSLSRSALVALAALASACAAAAATAAWTTPRGPSQNVARERSGHSLSSAGARALADVGTHTTDDVDIGSQFVTVKNSNLFQAGDQITLLDNSVKPEVSEQGLVVLVEENIDRLVLQKPVSNHYPKSSVVISPNAAARAPAPAPTPAPTSAPTPAPTSAPTSAPTAAASIDMWGRAAPSGLPPLPPPSSRVVAPSSRLVAPPPPDTGNTEFVIDDGGHRGGGHHGGGHHGADEEDTHIVTDNIQSHISTHISPAGSTASALLPVQEEPRGSGSTASTEHHKHKAAQGEPMEWLGWFSVIFASVVCCVGCLLVCIMYFFREQATAFIERVGGFDKGADTSSSRPDDPVTEVFNQLDINGDGFLDVDELFVLAKHIGFPGDLAEWNGSYSWLAKKHFEGNEKQGCTLLQFTTIIADENGGFYVSDAAMESFLDSRNMDE